MAEATATVKNDFTKGPMWQVILKMSIPMMLAQLVNVLYNVVDRMYIGHIEDVGAMALTGLGLSIVHDAVLAHGGTISVGANRPRGSVFQLDFPRPAEEETGI